MSNAEGYRAKGDVKKFPFMFKMRLTEAKI